MTPLFPPESSDLSLEYDELLEFVVASGRRIVRQAGELEDIGTKKRFLTDEDLRIERELFELTRRLFPGDGFLAEEEYDSPPPKRAIGSAIRSAGRARSWPGWRTLELP